MSPGQGTIRSANRNFISCWPIYTGQAISIDDWQARMWPDTGV
ncbi:hypothetical protein AB0O86_19605 [Streptomyces hirsutus]